MPKFAANQRIVKVHGPSTAPGNSIGATATVLHPYAYNPFYANCDMEVRLDVPVPTVTGAQKRDVFVDPNYWEAVQETVHG